MPGRFNEHMEHTRHKHLNGSHSAGLPPWLTLAALVVLATTVLAGCTHAAASSGKQSAGSSSMPHSSNASTPPLPEAYDIPSAQDLLAENAWGNLLSALGSEALAFGRRVQDELPVAAYAQWSGVGGGEPLELTDPAQIRALFNALAGASLGEEASQVTTDDSTAFWFVFADGERFSVSLDSLALVLYKDGHYTAYLIDANDDFYLFAELARQKTLSGYAGDAE